MVMDAFKWVLLTETLVSNPQLYTEDEFEEIVTLLSPDDTLTLLRIFTTTKYTVEQGKHVSRLAHVLWHYY